LKSFPLNRRLRSLEVIVRILQLFDVIERMSALCKTTKIELLFNGFHGKFENLSTRLSRNILITLNPRSTLKRLKS